MTTLILKQEKSQKNVQSPVEKTFHRLTKKIASLKCKLIVAQEELNQAQSFFNEKIRPLMPRWKETLTNSLLRFYEFYKLKRLSKQEQEDLKNIILSKAREVFNGTLHEIDPKLATIFEELNGTAYEEDLSQEMSSFREEMMEMFKEQGFDVDLSDLDPNDNSETFKEKFFDSVKNSFESRAQQEEAKPSKKTKRQLEKEQKMKQAEALQKKSLSAIYKQLAKALHPDLELDPIKKLEKEELMKKLTTAYEKEDLFTLLSLEVEWMTTQAGEEGIPRQSSEEQLKTYNSLLKNQVSVLEADHQFLYMAPKYMDLHPYLSNCKSLSPKAAISRGLDELIEEISLYENTALDLQNVKNDKALKTVKAILGSNPENMFDEIMKEFGALLSEDDDFLDDLFNNDDFSPLKPSRKRKSKR